MRPFILKRGGKKKVSVIFQLRFITPKNVKMVTFLLDVLDVLTEVDEKSKRNPEIIQYFVVSLFNEVHHERMCVVRNFLWLNVPCVLSE